MEIITSTWTEGEKKLQGRGGYVAIIIKAVELVLSLWVIEWLKLIMNTIIDRNF